MNQAIIVSVTASSEAEALTIADALVSERLAACAQLFPVTSVFRWDGAVQREREVMLAIKTRAGLFDRLVKTVLAHHSYDIPEIVAAPIVAGHAPYLDWIAAETETGG